MSLITFPPNVSGKNDTTPKLDETTFTAEQLTTENEQRESGYNEFSERGTILKKNYISSKIN